MDVAKRNQFIARLSRALGRDQEMCPAFVEGFDYSHGPQETMFQDLSRDQILTMFKEQCQRVGTKFVETTPDKLGETILAAIEDWGNGKIVFPSSPEVEEYKLKNCSNKMQLIMAALVHTSNGIQLKVVKNVFLILLMLILVLHSHTVVLRKLLL